MFSIVTDSITSDGLTHFIEQELKGVHHRFKRGYKNVINEAIRLNESGQESWLAIETSGHGAMKENYFLDDGACLWNGITDKVAWLKGKVSGVVDKIKGWFTSEDGFDTHSPSKWTEKIGEWVMQG
ncbi:hypothetical protein V6O07_08025, partial [Arthrospira platensis SPKY2]